MILCLVIASPKPIVWQQNSLTAAIRVGILRRQSDTEVLQMATFHIPKSRMNRCSEGEAEIQPADVQVGEATDEGSIEIEAASRQEAAWIFNALRDVDLELTDRRLAIATSKITEKPQT